MFNLKIQKLRNPRQNRTGFEYNAFFKLNPVPMFIYSQSTLKFLDVNPAAVRIYGYTYDEFLSMTIENIRPEEDKIKLKHLLKANLQSSRISANWRHRKKDGTIIYVQVYSHPINYPPYKDARLVTAYDVTGKKLAEENLIKSEQRFRDLAELLPQIVFEFDLDGKLLYANRLAYKTFQYPYDTDINLINVFDFLSPNQYEMAHEDLARVMAGEKIENREYVLYKKDGTTFTALIIVSPIVHNNHPVGFRGVIIDVSELKNIHKELRYSQKKYSSLFENAYSIMMILDPESGKFVDANNAASNFYGYPIGKLKEMTLSEISTEPPDKINEAVRKAMSFKQNQFIRLHRLSNGNKRFVEVFTSPIFINGKNFLFLVIHDIQDRMLAEKNLKKLNKAIEQSPVSVVITDREGNIEYVNPKFCVLTGYQSEETVGKNPRILKSEEHNDDFYKRLWTTITSGRNWYGEFKNKKKSGEFYWESASISPILDENENITHFVAIKEDITERKIREHELLQAKEKAEEASKLKSYFLANMSHELRTPLVGILGYAEILSGELASTDHKEMANIILQSGQQLIDTLNSILDLSRVEANRTELDIKTYDLYEILSECCSLFKQSAKNKKLYLNFNVPPKHLYVDTDKNLLIKVINNLINNAIKFTSHGGITISAELVLNKDNHMVEIKVSDSGIGIPDKYQGLIFEPFRQVSEGLSRSFTGSGLGLTLSKKFIDLLNGSIKVNSKEGAGTTFTITLPYSKTNRLLTPEIKRPDYSKLLKLQRRPLLLLVEDDEINAQIVLAYLNPYFEIDHVPDGEGALGLCRLKQYDTILMDIALRGSSGTSTMQEIKKMNTPYSQIPIIALTAYAMHGDKESFLKAGFSHYISKPFTRTQLFELLASIFNPAG